MADKVGPEVRSRIMARVGRRDTPPEIAVRRILHAAGFRFRVHRVDLPGKPDVALPKYRIAIFVHGCFWHQHPGCRRARRPVSNTDYWERKLDRNVQRDRENIDALEAMGWRAVVVWECETRDAVSLRRFLDELI